MELVKTFSKAWKIPEIRSKMIFTLLMLLVFRIGSNIPVPGIDREYLANMFSGETGLLDLFDLFSGGAFSNFTIFALGICSGYYPIHHRIDHHSAVDDRVPVL